MTVAAFKKRKLKKVSGLIMDHQQKCCMTVDQEQNAAGVVDQEQDYCRSDEGGDPRRIGLKTRWFESLQSVGCDPRIFRIRR